MRFPTLLEGKRIKLFPLERSHASGQYLQVLLAPSGQKVKHKLEKYLKD